MNTLPLIDLIVQQTTVLIARLATAKGIRSPLAHVADSVFVSLARAIEEQGVHRKVAADLFGLALRTYQRKVQRLTASTGDAQKTLWEAVLEFVSQEPVSRQRILECFRTEDESAIAAVLGDLVELGLLHTSGGRDSKIYGATSEAERRMLQSGADEEVAAMMLWGSVFRRPGITTTQVLSSLRVDPNTARAALERLLADGRVIRDGSDDGAPLQTPGFVITEDNEAGWEAAVFDHFQAVANAIAAKLEARAEGATEKRPVGGSTLHYGIYPGHPFEAEVLGFLERVRGEANHLWNRVRAYNRAHPFDESTATRVTFYFGQNVLDPTLETDDGARPCENPSASG